MIVLKNTGGVIIAETELFLVHKRSNDSHLADQCLIHKLIRVDICITYARIYIYIYIYLLLMFAHR